MKLTNELVRFKLKNVYIDNYKIFQKNIKNKETKNEINRIQDFLLNSYKV